MNYIALFFILLFLMSIGMDIYYCGRIRYWESMFDKAYDLLSEEENRKHIRPDKEDADESQK